MDFGKILEPIKANFNEKFTETMKKWGGGVMAPKKKVEKVVNQLYGKRPKQAYSWVGLGFEARSIVGSWAKS